MVLQYICKLPSTTHFGRGDGYNIVRLACPTVLKRRTVDTVWMLLYSGPYFGMLICISQFFFLYASRTEM